MKLVSVPLRGIRYAETQTLLLTTGNSRYVSVPLRGLIMWKQLVLCNLLLAQMCFSPLAGIRYVETEGALGESTLLKSFSPLAGIRYVETQ